MIGFLSYSDDVDLLMCAYIFVCTRERSCVCVVYKHVFVLKVGEVVGTLQLSSSAPYFSSPQVQISLQFFSRFSRDWTTKLDLVLSVTT